jgi:MFS family permease
VGVEDEGARTSDESGFNRSLAPLAVHLAALGAPRPPCRTSAAASASYDEVTWILTTYLVANAVVLPMSAWLSRVFGRKNYYPGIRRSVYPHFIFLWVGANSWDHALEPRSAGLAGGGLAPVSQAILVDTFPPGSARLHSHCIRLRS